MKNVGRGLVSRSGIIESMEQGKSTVSEISTKSGLGRACVGYHLNLLLKQKTVRVVRTGREGRWSLTKYGQAKLP
jgi:predicted transcriptional regulator